MHHPHDQRFKALVASCMDVAVDVELERSVHVPAQRIDVAYEPRARVPQLGAMDRMVALGPGMMEYFASPISEADVVGCVRKRLNYAHERTLGRRGPDAPEPLLWILAARQLPRTMLQAYEVAPMSDWPHGFWQARVWTWMRFVVLNELPQGEDTLLLRLFAHGRTLQLAVAELRALPPDHLLQQRAWPVLVAYRHTIMQDLGEPKDMNALQEAQALYEEWAQRTRAEGARELLVQLVSQRFGELPAGVAARIESADHATLRRWASRVLTARSLDDVLA